MEVSLPQKTPKAGLCHSVEAVYPLPQILSATLAELPENPPGGLQVSEEGGLGCPGLNQIR